MSNSFNESSIKLTDSIVKDDIHSIELNDENNNNNKMNKEDKDSQINIDDLMAQIENPPAENNKDNPHMHTELEDIENFINSSFHPEKEKPKEEEKKEEIKEKEEESIKNLHINSIINKKDQPSEEEKTNKEESIMSISNKEEQRNMSLNDDSEISNEVKNDSMKDSFNLSDVHHEEASPTISTKNNYNNNNNPIKIIDSIKDIPNNDNPIVENHNKEIMSIEQKESNHTHKEVSSVQSTKKKPNLFDTLHKQNKLNNHSITSQDSITQNKSSSLNTSRTIKDFPFFICPFCCKDTPIITSLSSTTANNKSSDKISTLCSCGGNTLPLTEYISKLVKSSLSPNGNCYNQRHPPTIGIAYCGKCNRFLCEPCLQYHNDYLPKHITSPYKIPSYSKCLVHTEKDITEYCETCRLGLCEDCSDEHSSHSVIAIDELWISLNEGLPFKNMKQCVEYTESCIKISEKQKNKYVQYIDEFVNKLNQYKRQIEEQHKEIVIRLQSQSKLIQLTYSNFICFRKNYYQMQNMNTISLLCPTVYMSLGNDLIKGLKEYLDYIRNESIIDLTTKITKEDLDKLMTKYPMQNQSDTMTNESIPTLFKAINSKGIYYGECKRKRRNGRGIQFNTNGDIYEGYWNDGDIIKGKITFNNGNVYEGEIKNEKEDGYGIKKYKNGDEYKGYFKEGRKISKTFMAKMIEDKSSSVL